MANGRQFGVARGGAASAPGVAAMRSHHACLRGVPQESGP
jgi:hypothetical protein